MEYISTTALANELDIKSGDLFEKFKNLGWIDRKNDRWVLTDLGKGKGGKQETIQNLVSILCGLTIFQ